MRSKGDSPRHGSTRMLVLGSLGTMALIIGILCRVPLSGRWSARGIAKGEASELLVYCAASLQPAMEEAARQFGRDRSGGLIQIQYGGSGTLLSNLQVARCGDLYVAADESFVRLAEERDLTLRSWPLASMKLVIAVRHGNPRDVRGIDDLLRDDVVVGLPNPMAASAGKLAERLLRESGQWLALREKAIVFKPTVSDVAGDLALGAIEATILWDVMVRQQPLDFAAIEVPIFADHPQCVRFALLRSSAHPELAERFAAFLIAPKGGQVVLQRHHFTTLVEAGYATDRTP